MWNSSVINLYLLYIPLHAWVATRDFTHEQQHVDYETLLPIHFFSLEFYFLPAACWQAALCFPPTGNLYLSDVKEKYVMTYPSAYARSILTVPWSELGGRCGITCEATGFTANITFHTKPMYGGLPHRYADVVHSCHEKCWRSHEVVGSIPDRFFENRVLCKIGFPPICFLVHRK